MDKKIKPINQMSVKDRISIVHQTSGLVCAPFAGGNCRGHHGDHPAVSGGLYSGERTALPKAEPFCVGV